MWDTSGGTRNGLQDCKDGRLGDYHLQPLEDVAPLFAVRTCWGTDRMALYYSGAKFISGTGPSPSSTTIPPTTEIEIRAGADGCQSVLYRVQWSPAAYGGADFILQITSRLATQWEVWARAVPGDGTYVTVGATFRLLIDRTGGWRNGAPGLQLGPEAQVVP
jgi:hypothetical protein